MDFLELVSSRQSVRAFDPERSVEKEKLDRIIEIARLAPSACNAQPWSFVLVDEPTSALDSNTSERVAAYFKELASQGAAVLAVSHDDTLAAQFGKQLQLSPLS